MLSQGPSVPQKLAYGVDRANVPDAIEKVRSGDFGGIHVDLIARAGAVEAIPALKQQFACVEDSLLKAKIAGALLRLGDKDETYWNFLVEYASPALESDAPNFAKYDAQGKSEPGPSPELAAWLEQRGISPESAGENSVYLQPGRVLMLGWSRDRRAIPYLRRGLSSPNYMIEIAAAEGLAEIGDESSIPLIIAACRRAPAEVAETIADSSLVYFDDNTTQTAVDHYVRKTSPKRLAKLEPAVSGPRRSVFRSTISHQANESATDATSRVKSACGFRLWGNLRLAGCRTISFRSRRPNPPISPPASSAVPTRPAFLYLLTSLLHYFSSASPPASSFVSGRKFPSRNFYLQIYLDSNYKMC